MSRCSTCYFLATTTACPVSIIHPRRINFNPEKAFARNEEFRSALEDERMPPAALGVPPPAAASAGCRFRRCRSSSCVLRERSRCASVCSRPSSVSSSRARTWDTQDCSLATSGCFTSTHLEQPGAHLERSELLLRLSALGGEA